MFLYFCQYIVEKVIKNNAEAIVNYKKGRGNALQYLIGQVMKETKGKVNPKIASEMLIEKLKAEYEK